MIPKIIHYCWLSNDPYPQNLINYMKTWEQKLPDYQFILWNLSKFDINSSIWVKQAFENKKYAFAADYIRLYAVYNYGGIYLDMDIEVLKSFNNLLDKDVMLAYENNSKIAIEAGCFGATKGNSFIKRCLDHYKNRKFIKDDGLFDMITLPKIMYTYLPNNHKFEIYNSDYFTCKSYETGFIQTTPNSYAIHNFAGSWISKWQRQYDESFRKINIKMGRKASFFLTIPLLLNWQLHEYGFSGFMKKLREFLKTKNHNS